MSAIATPTQRVSSAAEPIYRLRELHALGYEHPQVMRERIQAGEVPAEVLDKRGTYGIRESHLGLLRRRTKPAAEAGDKAVAEALARRLVAKWSDYSPEQRSRIGGFLAA